jgi:hypothetical protein
MSRELSTITDQNRPQVLEWLRDRSAFHVWLSSLVTGSLVVSTIFGSRAGLSGVTERVLAVAAVLMLFSLVCNLVCVWSIPSWKYRVSTGIVTDATKLRRELAITAWLGVIAFVSGLTLGIIGNSGA